MIYFRRIVSKLEDLFYNRVSVIQTIYFNFYYLPWRQAIKLPIYLHKPKIYREWGGRNFFFNLNGTVRIETNCIYRGMIRLGFIQGTSHIDNGFIWSNRGVVIFKGKCDLASGSSIRNGGGQLCFGNNVRSNPNTKFICYHSISIGENTINSWDVTFCDYDFHAMKNAITEKKIRPYGKIEIGDNNWIGQNVLILKNTKTPNYTTISAGAVVSHKYKCEEKSIIGGNPAELITEGTHYMDCFDCVFDNT